VMRYIQTLFILWVSLFFLSACAPTQYKKSESALILIKTKKLKYADLGYIRRNADEVRADLFIAGTLVQSIEIKNLVCVNEGCMTKSSFNEDYLHPSYPDDLMLNVLLARPIFDRASMKITDTGFIQKLKSPEYNIVYKIENEKIYFKDRLNKILIKISKTKG
jgi:hypothetical protein